MRAEKVVSVGLMVIAFGLAAGQAVAQAPPAAAPAAGQPAVPPPPPKVVPPKTQDVGKAGEGDALPDIKLPFAFENKMASLKELAAKGKGTTLVSFINTACSSCIGEVRLLQDLDQKHGDKLQIVVVVTDRSADRVSKMLGAKDTMTYLIDPNFSAPPVFGFKSTPGLAMIKDGKVVKLVTGFIPSDEGQVELTAAIESVIK